MIADTKKRFFDCIRAIMRGNTKEHVMQSYEEQFNQIIAEGRVHRALTYETSDYFPFLFSVADFLTSSADGYADFHTWSRWNARYVEMIQVEEEEVNRAYRGARREEELLDRLGLMIPFAGRGFQWRSSIPAPAVIRRFLMTPEEVEEELRENPRFYLDGGETPEEVKQVMKARFPRLTAQVIEGLRRGYQKADEFARMREDDRQGVNLSRLFDRKMI